MTAHRLSSSLLPPGLAAACAALLLFSGSLAAATVNWPQFRGPDASGVTDDPAPVTWNVESGENIRWQTPIPGLGHACPIVWQDRVYVATAVKPGSKSKLKLGLYGDVDSYKEKEIPQQGITSEICRPETSCTQHVSSGGV